MSAIKLYIYSNQLTRTQTLKENYRFKVKQENTHKAFVHTQRTRMHTIQNTMSLLINPLHPPLRRTPPRQKYNSSCTFLIHNIDYLLRKLLPPMFRMTICLMSSHRQAGIEQ